MSDKSVPKTNQPRQRDREASAKVMGDVYSNMLEHQQLAPFPKDMHKSIKKAATATGVYR